MPGQWGSAGGVQRRWGECAGAREVLACYSVKFGDGEGFEFVKGGKGGLGFQFGAARIQSGSWDPAAASQRAMWRRGGAGTGYLYYGSATQGGDYSEQLPAYAEIAVSTGAAGHSLWQAGKVAGALPASPKGRWVRTCVYGRMNTPGGYDGLLGVSYDGEVRRYDTLAWVKTPTALDSTEFSVWFGGSDASWSPTANQTIYFRDLVVSTR